jgi:hypothetical protein
MTAKSSTSKLSPLERTYSDEATLLSKVIAYLEPQRRDGIKVIKIRDRYAKGYSDLFICVRGIFVVAELKDDTGKPSQHQKDFVKEMQECGAIGHHTCRTVQDVIDLVEEAKRRQPKWPI